MKKLLSLTVAVLLGIGSMFANPVDVTTAKTIGQKFVQANFDQTRSSNLELIYTFTARTGETSFYVFSVGEKGFVIVSANDNFRPIIGYSYDDNYNVDNRESNFYLNSIANGMAETRNNTPDPKVAEEWESVMNYGRLLSHNNGRGVDYLCQTIWNQNPAPFNSLCPEDPLGPGGHAYVGCVATAMAQIMKYWNYPEQGQGSHTYTCNANPWSGYQGHPEYGPQTANFGATTYDWAHMLNSYNGSYTPEEGNAVAVLSYHCGVSVDMMYGNSQAPDYGSGAFSADVPGAIVQYFKYSSAATMRNYANDLSAWETMLRDQLDLGWPVYHSGSSSEGGHAFVCDGYNDEGLFHYNWGWGGSMGWYVANGMEYNTNMAAIINFVPADVYNNALQAPTNVTVVKTSDVAQEATITWTNPTKTLSNQNISTIDHMVVERNGKVIYTSESTTPGASMTFTDTSVPCYSTFEYRVYAVCSGARGKYASASESFGPTCEWKIVASTTSTTGWKGGYLQAYDGAGNLVDQYTMTSGGNAIYNMSLTLGKVAFRWKAGNDNVAVTINLKDASGTSVYQYNGTSNDIPEGDLYVANNGCGNAAPTQVPGELFSTAAGDNIVLTWSSSAKTDYGYNVYRDGYLIALTHETEFVDEAPAMGGHCYEVCILTDGGESALSNETCATAGEGCGAPRNLWFEAQTNHKPIITWDAAENMSANDGYIVYRKDGEDGEYKQIKILGSNKTEYKETKTLTDGVWYYYRVMATYDESGCTSAPAKARYGNEFFVKYLYSLDGVDENMTKTISVYPNPVKDLFTVQADNLSSVVIYNSLGQKVFAQTFDGNEATIDMSGYDAGIYMVRIVADGNEITRKVSVIR